MPSIDLTQNPNDYDYDDDDEAIPQRNIDASTDGDIQSGQPILFFFVVEEIALNSTLVNSM